MSDQEVLKEGDKEKIRLTSTLAAQTMRLAKEKASKYNEKPQVLMDKVAAFLIYKAAEYNQADVAKQILMDMPNFF